MKPKRYSIQISFKGERHLWLDKTKGINEQVATLKEALEYGSMIDDTVETARIVDNINQTIVMKWK